MGVGDKLFSFISEFFLFIKQEPILTIRAARQYILYFPFWVHFSFCPFLFDGYFLWKYTFSSSRYYIEMLRYEVLHAHSSFNSAFSFH